MATKAWLGGAAATTQVDTGTLAGTWEATDNITTTLTAEDGSTTQAVTTVAGSTTIETIRDSHLSDLQASTNNLFQRLTFAASSTNAITATANVSGVPFYIAGTTTETGGGAADAQTFSYASTTANTGPNDFNTAGNWSDSTVPTSTGDIVFFNQGAFDVLYGLNKAAVDLNTLKVGSGYKGAIGDVEQGYYLIIDVSNGTPSLVINGGKTVWLDGDFDKINIQRAMPSKNAIKFKGKTENVYISGSSVKGTITFGNSMAHITSGINIYSAAPSAKIIVGSSVASIKNVFVSSGGQFWNSSDVETEVRVTSGEYTQLAGSDTGPQIVLYSIHGGIVKHYAAAPSSNSAVTTINLDGGEIDFSESRGDDSATITVDTINQRGGNIMKGPVSATLAISTYNYFSGSQVPESSTSP